LRATWGGGDQKVEEKKKTKRQGIDPEVQIMLGSDMGEYLPKGRVNPSSGDLVLRGSERAKSCQSGKEKRSTLQRIGTIAKNTIKTPRLRCRHWLSAKIEDKKKHPEKHVIVAA